jgi:hypothetical protein
VIVLVALLACRGSEQGFKLNYIKLCGFDLVSHIDCSSSS